MASKAAMMIHGKFSSIQSKPSSVETVAAVVVVAAGAAVTTGAAVVAGAMVVGHSW